MKSNTERAEALMKSCGYTCVLCKDDELYTSTERGVKPLLMWLESKTDLRGFSAADKVVGKAAAMLYILLGVDEVYAPVMSLSAIEAFKEHGVSAFYEVSTAQIRNRADTGCCPMEAAVADIGDPREAEKAIRKRLEEMRK